MGPVTKKKTRVDSDAAAALLTCIMPRHRSPHYLFLKHVQPVIKKKKKCRYLWLWKKIALWCLMLPSHIYRRRRTIDVFGSGIPTVSAVAVTCAHVVSGTFPVFICLGIFQNEESNPINH